MELEAYPRVGPSMTCILVAIEIILKPRFATGCITKNCRYRHLSKDQLVFSPKPSILTNIQLVTRNIQ